MGRNTKRKTCYKMKLANILLLFFIYLKIGNAQIDLLDTIYLKIYSGSDYRSENIEMGATDNIDSLVYTLSNDKEYYISEKIFQARNIYTYENGSFSNASVNKDSTITIYSNSWAEVAKIEELIYWSNLNNYEEKVLEFQISFGDGDLTSHYDTLLTIRNIDIKDFGIDEDNFRIECKYLNHKNDKKKRCRKVDYDELFNQILNENFGIKVVSSYAHYIKISFKIDDDSYEITQSYPGDFNIKWSISVNNCEGIYVINPHLNEILYNLIPREIPNRNSLLEYRDASNIFRLID